MKEKMKKVLAVLLIVVLAFGWYATIQGVGSMDPIKDKMQLGLDIKGGVNVVMEVKSDAEGEELVTLMNQTKEVISRRVDNMGISNADVRVEGDKRIRVELPGAKDSQDAIDQIGKTAQLNFLLADGSLVLDGSQIKNASVGSAEKGGYAVDVEFKSEGAKAFEEATKVCMNGGVKSSIKGIPGNAIIILLDDQIISYPVPSEVISGGKCQITGNFEQKEATQLAALIRGGALPAPLEEVSSSAQSAKIGLDAYDQSVKAGMIGLVLIFIIMILGYRIMGVAADIALAMYVLIIIAVMAFAGNVLTLPGIAGIILSVGMAVDANVVIFTRIKEEIMNGKSTRVAVQSGFKRAMSTVIDSQVTTLIAAIILYQIGTSAVKGFAWTLIIGIVASLITAVVITQLYLSIFANTKKFADKKFYGIKADGTPSFALHKKFKFIANRKKFMMVSAIILIIGLCSGIFRGFNYGIDFTGGTMVQIDMGQKVEMEKVDEVLDKDGINAEVVYAGDANEEIIIRTVQALENKDREAMISDLQKEFKFADEDVLDQKLFGPTIGDELKTNAIKAVLLAALGMLIYIRIRFREWFFGASALLGVLHDVLIVCTFYSLFGITVNNSFIAGILTVVGYSINDTIVIFDRIRENNRIMNKPLDETIDIAINQTLSRSIMTTVTTLIVMVPLYVMTSSAIREFVLPLMVGIAVGCLSSIFICSPLYYEMSKKKTKTKYEKHLESLEKNKKAHEKEERKAKYAAKMAAKKNEKK